MTTTTTDAPALERLSSGIPGLDTVLGGGFFRSGVYILHGLPGSGKTIFANQLCFAHVAAGGTAVYVTLLAESHSRMLQHIRALRFFDETAIPERLTYLSAFHQLETGGLKGLVGGGASGLLAGIVAVTITPLGLTLAGVALPWIGGTP